MQSLEQMARIYQQYANKNSARACVMHMMNASTEWYMCCTVIIRREYSVST